MALNQPADRRAGRRSRDASPYEDERSARYYDERDDGRRKEYEDSRDREPRYASKEKRDEPRRKTASFAVPDEGRGGKGGEDPLAYGDKRGGRHEESRERYYDEPSSKPKYAPEPQRERSGSRERSSKLYYGEERRYEQEPRKREAKQYYDDEYERTETRYEVSKPAAKYESSPKPKYAQPVYAAPSIAAATVGSVMSKKNPNYRSEDSDSESSESDGPTGERRLDVEIDFKHHDKSDVTIRKRPDRHSKKYHVDEHSSALVTTTTTTSGARLDNQYVDQGRYGYDRPPSGRPVEVDYERFESQRPGYASRTSETKITKISTNGKVSEAAVVTAEPGHRHRPSLGATLGVAGSLAAGARISDAPGSPMLEAYRGTYQSMGSMPSPLMMPSAGFSSASDVALYDLNRAPSPSGRQLELRAHFADLTADAATLKVALRDRGKSRPPPAEPFIRILPPLGHEQVLQLRREYKKQVLTPDRRGVNVAKHIKVRLKGDKDFLKCCYTTALGKYESEGYWANSYYQGAQTSRELLIEALMGKSNAEIRAIKDTFRDKKYSDDLVKCMSRELKEDKFKYAVLKVLNEEKMEEPTRMYPLDRYVVDKDVRELYSCIRAEKGGETAMIRIVVLRSEAHMREVLRVYENTYHANFAREMLRKSGNLVGEMLAHILNGIINRPVRDALLLHHALSLPVDDPRRNDLLISRLVRYHWERAHMELVKREFRSRYGRELREAVRAGTGGAWGGFCEMLCVTRVGDEVREYGRAERIV